MLCICGVCIPYNALWPILLLFLKQAWDYFSGTKKDKEAVEDVGKVRIRGASTAAAPSKFAGYVGDLENDEQYKELVAESISSDSIFVIKFTATWCKPCQALQPVFEKVLEEYKDRVYAVSIDVDNFDELGAKHHAVMLPLLVAIRDGVEIKRFHGKDESDVRQFIESITQPSVKVN